MQGIHIKLYTIIYNGFYYMLCIYKLTGFDNHLESRICLGILFLNFNGHLIGH